MLEYKVQYLTVGGELTDTEPEIGSNILGKVVHNLETNHTKYYLRMEEGHLVDPNNRDERRFKLNQGQLRIVKEDAFNLYHSFLRGTTAALRQAEREL